MSAHHYAAKHFELPLAMYIAEKAHGLVKYCGNLFHAFSERLEHRAAAEQLARLDERLLRDIGIEHPRLIKFYVSRGRR